jgi:hypothetical protein
VKKYILLFAEYVFIFSLLIMTGCEETSEFFEIDRSNQIESVVSFAHGEILKSGEPLEFTFKESSDYSDARPDVLKVVFRDISSLEVVSVEERALVFSQITDVSDSEVSNVENPTDEDISSSTTAENVEDLAYDDSLEDITEPDFFETDDESEKLAEELVSDLIEDVSSPFGEPEYPIEVPVLSPGLYIAEIILYEDSNIVSDVSVPFYSGMVMPAVDVITSYPTIAYPGGDCRFSLLPSFPFDDKMFIVWSVDDKPVYSALVKDGGSEFIWNVPSYEGVFNISAEIYPLNPELYAERFNSPYSRSTVMYVQKEQVPDQNEFAVESNYSSLYHFRGETVDHAGSLELTREGFIVPGSYSSLSGYKVVKGSRLTCADIMIPYSRKEGFRPFTLSGKIMFLSANAGAFFKVEGAESLFELGINGNGVIYSKLTLDGKDYFSEYFAPLLDETAVYSFSFLPWGKKIRLAAYINGVYKASDSFVVEGNITSSVLVHSWVTELLGNQDVIIDEFGVYSKDETGAPAIMGTLLQNFAFNNSLENIYFIDGFDSLPHGEDEDCFFIENSFLYPCEKGYSTEVQFQSDRSLNFYFDLENQVNLLNGLELVFSFADEKISLLIKGGFVFIDGEKLFTVKKSGNLLVSINSSNEKEKINFEINGKSVTLTKNIVNIENMTLVVRNILKERNVKVDSIVISSKMLSVNKFSNGRSAEIINFQ